MKNRITVYPFLSKDYSMIESWWVKRKYPATNEILLPPSGVVVSFDGKPVCAGFIHMSNKNGFASLGQLVSDPESNKGIRSQCLDLLITTLINYAKEKGCGAISAATNIPTLIERYKRLGLKEYDKNVTHLGRVF